MKKKSLKKKFKNLTKDFDEVCELLTQQHEALCVKCNEAVELRKQITALENKLLVAEGILKSINVELVFNS